MALEEALLLALVLRWPVVGVSSVGPYAMTPAGSIRRTERWMRARVAVRVDCCAQVRHSVQALGLEEVKQLSDSWEAVSCQRTVEHRLNTFVVASCHLQVDLAHRNPEVQNCCASVVGSEIDC